MVEQQGGYEIEVITPWLYKATIEWECGARTNHFRTSQKVLYLIYYFINPLGGQYQVTVNLALIHYRAWLFTRGIGWQLPIENPQIPLTPVVPLILKEKPRRRPGF